MDRTVGDTFFVAFTTRIFATGVPGTLAGTPVVSAYEDAGLVQITAGITLGVDHDGVTGLNMLTIVATGANGFESGKDYNLVITTGTVSGVSVVGEVVGSFSLGLSAAAVDLANATDGLGAIKGDTAAVLVDTGTTIPALLPAALVGGRMDSDLGSIGGVVQSATDLKDFADAGYDPATNKVQGVVLVDTTTANTDMRGTDNAALASVATETRLAELDAANLPATTDNIETDTQDIQTRIPAVGPVEGTSDSGTTTTMVDAARTEADTDYWKGLIVVFTSGTLLGQARLITGFTPASDTITFSPATTVAVGTHTYRIVPAGRADVELWLGGLVNALIAGRVDSNAQAGLAPLGTAMRGTDSAALASVATEARLAELDAANLPADIDSILTDTGTTLDTKINDIQGATFSSATDSLEAIRDRGDAAWTTGAGGSDRLLLADTTIATLASQTSFTLTAGSADNDAYNNCTIVIEDAATATQKAIGLISAYVGATKTVTLKYDPAIFTMAATDKVYILAENALKATAANRQLNVAADGDIAGNVDGSVASVVGHTAQTGDSFARLGLPAGASIAADLVAIDNFVDDLESRLTAARATNLDELGSTNIPADIDTLLGRLTAARAALLDEITAARLSELDAGTSGKAANQIDLIKTEADKIALVDASAGVAGSVIEEVENRATPAQVNTEVDNALNTAIPVSPTADSINERIAAVDDLSQASGAGDLTAILTDTGTTIPALLPAALVGGRMDADVGAKTGNVALSAQEKLDVNTEVDTALGTTTYAEPGQGAPGATISLAAKIGYLYKNFRNRKRQSSSTWELYNDDATTVDQKATVSDDGTNAEKTEIATGP